MLTSSFSKATLVLIILGASSLSAQAEYQKYNYENSGGWLNGFWVDDYGRHVVLAGKGIGPQFTSIYSQGTRTDYSFDTRGVSSDGRVFGSAIGSNGKSAAAYLDFSGQLNLFSLPASSWGAGGSSYIDRMNGNYTSVRSEGGPASPGIPEQYRYETYENGTYLHGWEGEYSDSRMFATHLDSNGILHINEFQLSNEVLIKPSGERIVLLNYDGTGILQDWQGNGDFTVISDISDNGLMLLTLGNVDSSQYSQKIYDPSTEVYTDIVSDKFVARINNSGDYLSIDGDSNNRAQFWYRKNGEEWVNATELSGLGSVQLSSLSDRVFFNFDMTNSGYIYGMTGRNGTNAFNEAFVMAPVPEPGTMLLLAAGAGGLIAARRMKKQA